MPKSEDPFDTQPHEHKPPRRQLTEHIVIVPTGVTTRPTLSKARLVSALARSFYGWRKCKVLSNDESYRLSQDINEHEHSRSA